MHLPKLTSIFSLPLQSVAFGENTSVLFASIHLAATSACVARCTNAANACSFCRPTDKSCWDNCAGAGVGNCVADCP